jgi:hypothetical protein
MHHRLKAVDESVFAGCLGLTGMRDGKGWTSRWNRAAALWKKFCSKKLRKDLNFASLEPTNSAMALVAATGDRNGRSDQDEVDQRDHRSRDADRDQRIIGAEVRLGLEHGLACVVHHAAHVTGRRADAM